MGRTHEERYLAGKGDGFMWKRAELKRRGREKLKRNYWPAVAVSLVLAVMMTDISGPFLLHGKKYNLVSILWTDFLIPWKFSGTIIKTIIRDIFYVFIFAIIEVGGAAFFIRNRKEKAGAALVFSGFFDGNYKKYMKGMFLVHLELFFWYLMLLVPGIIQSYAFRMAPYILAENPDAGFEEILHTSEDMMRGQKWRAFLLDLSFLGWRVLTILTFGVLGIFFTGPYIEAVNAELYAVLKEERMRRLDADRTILADTAQELD